MTASEEELVSNMSKYQQASKPGHRTMEHLYIVMSLMIFYKKKKDAMFVTLFDLARYFNKETAIDCHFKLHKSMIRGKLYRLHFLINHKLRIKVRTPVGVSDEADLQGRIGQGTVMAGIVSSVNLDSGVQEHFQKDGRNEYKEKN